jgi:hypothetical protein
MRTEQVQLLTGDDGNGTKVQDGNILEQDEQQKTFVMISAESCNSRVFVNKTTATIQLPCHNKKPHPPLDALLSS